MPALSGATQGHGKGADDFIISLNQQYRCGRFR